MPNQEKLWELFQKLPQELKSLIFSEKAAQDIQSICEKNAIKGEEKISSIANYIGYVLHGALPVKDLQSVLEKEVNLKKEIAEKITREIVQIIFLPVKTSLEQLYKSDIIVERKIIAEEKTRPVKKDSYREPIE